MIRKKSASTESTTNCSNCSNSCGKCSRSKSATKSNQVEIAKSAGKRCKSNSTCEKSSSTRSRSSK